MFLEKYLTLNLSLVDPRKKERFGDPMIAIIEITREENKSEIESINDNDSQIFDEKQFYSQNNNNQNQLGENCNKVIGYIDSVLHDFDDNEDPSFFDSKKFATNDYQNSDEIKMIQAREEEENRRKIKEFQDLISESRIEMKGDNFMDDEDRIKIEKVQKIIGNKRNDMV